MLSVSGAQPKVSSPPNRVLTSLPAKLFTILDEAVKFNSYTIQIPDADGQLIGSIHISRRKIDRYPWKECKSATVHVFNKGSFTITPHGSSTPNHTVTIESTNIKYPGDGKSLKPLHECLKVFLSG